ncbi:MAG: hypothetical protein IIV61_02735 [Oscillospiraceae bacterium]|nr:hypothetical protein [Oscillospiraceae bacterium]
MKKNGFTRRTISLLLVIMMVIQVLPLGVLAAKGDIVSLEDIGFDPETQNQKGAINWPIKIYDYLNDGMLFEPANSRADSASASVVGRK